MPTVSFGGEELLFSYIYYIPKPLFYFSSFIFYFKLYFFMFLKVFYYSGFFFFLSHFLNSVLVLFSFVFPVFS